MERFNWTWGDTKKPTGERGIKINEKTVISYKPNGELITLIQGSAFKLEKDSHIYLTRQEIFDLAEELRKPDSLITGTGEETMLGLSGSGLNLGSLLQNSSVY